MVNRKLLKLWYIQTTSGLKSDEPEIPGLASYGNKYTHYGMCEGGNEHYKGQRQMDTLVHTLFVFPLAFTKVYHW